MSGFNADWYAASLEKKQQLGESPFARSPVEPCKTVPTVESVASLQSELDGLLDRVEAVRAKIRQQKMGADMIFQGVAKNPSPFGC